MSRYSLCLYVCTVCRENTDIVCMYVRMYVCIYNTLLTRNIVCMYVRMYICIYNTLLTRNMDTSTYVRMFTHL